MPRKLYINNLLNNAAASSVAPVELYFDIEAQSDLNLDYLLGVLVVDRQAKRKVLCILWQRTTEDEELIWQQFLDLVWQYPKRQFSFLFLRS